MYIGIDLGGTKTEIICLGEQGEQLYRHRVASPQQSYSATINTIRQLVEQAEQTLYQQSLSQSNSVGVGIPGSISLETQAVQNSNSVWLNGRPFKTDLEAALGRSVRLENDANCFALSEAIDGAGKNQSLVFGAILGTGCGGGIVAQGSLLSGPNGLGGEWGHNPLPFPAMYTESAATQRYQAAIDFFDRPGRVERSAIYQEKASLNYQVDKLEEAEYPGPLCYCGKRGCLETWISGTGLSRDYQRSTSQIKAAEIIVERAHQGEQAALNSLQRYYERLAKSFAQIINTLDPDIIVCGGGMSNIGAIYTQIPSRWDKYIFSPACKTKLVPAVYGDSSGVRGAALLWK